jgi:thiamine biosynthesis lipoprotein
MRPIPVAALALLAACGKPAPPAPSPSAAKRPSASAAPLPAPPATSQARAEHHGVVMGSELAIEVYGPDVSTCDRAVTAARAELERLDAMLTDWKPVSPLMDINRAAGVRPVRVPPELIFILRRSLEISELTGGAFDVSFGAAGRLWNWRAPDPRIPTPDEVRKALEDVGWKHVVLDEKAGTVFLDRPGVRIGLDAIGPGYAADLAMDKVRALGIRDALIDMSGDIRVIGRRAGHPWRIGIRHPRNPEADLDTLTVSEAGVATSGDYGRFFIKDGRRYSHIIDPRTGYPADACQSVTVVAPVLAFADALSTALCVMGPGPGMALVERLEGVEALFVAADGSIRVSKGLKR